MDIGVHHTLDTRHLPCWFLAVASPGSVIPATALLPGTGECGGRNRVLVVSSAGRTIHHGWTVDGKMLSRTSGRDVRPGSLGFCNHSHICVSGPRASTVPWRGMAILCDVEAGQATVKSHIPGDCVSSLICKAVCWGKHCGWMWASCVYHHRGVVTSRRRNGTMWNGVERFDSWKAYTIVLRRSRRSNWRWAAHRSLGL